MSKVTAAPSALSRAHHLRGGSSSLARSSAGFGPHAGVRREGADPSRRNATNLVHEVVSSPGVPLDPHMRAALEPRLGGDFSAVRLHTDGAAARSAQALDANAYTVGHHIAFAPGRFAPTTSSGQRLIAHELAHVVQQAGVSDLSSPARSDLSVGSPADRLEGAADRAADQALAAGPAANQPAMALANGAVSTRGLVQRQAATQPESPTGTPTAGANQGAGKSAPGGSVAKAPVEAWDYVQPLSETELVFSWIEMGQRGMRQTNSQIQQFFDPFDKEAKIDQTLADILNINAGGAGNILQDTLSQYASTTGYVGGALAQGVQVIMAHTLNTDSVADAKSQAAAAADEVQGKEFVRTSPEFKQFDAAALAHLETEFDQYWSWYGRVDSRFNEPDKYVLNTAWRDVVRDEYGVDSEPSQKVLTLLKQAVQKILDPIKAPLLKKLRDRRYKAGVLGGAISGALIGTAIGAAAKKSVLGGVVGGLIGLGAGALIGAGAAWIANRISKRGDQK
jgi:hypothetical protein